MIPLLSRFALLHCGNLEDFSQHEYDRLFQLCYEFMPAQLVPLSRREQSRAFGCAVSLGINRTRVLWQKGKGEEGGKEREKRESLILHGYVF